jgi:phytoene dehydrogenase-like protein
MAEAGHSVCVIEAESEIGGSCRSGELTLHGFTHDICAAVFPLAAASPFFKALPLEQYGLEWIRSPACLAHPLESGAPAILWPSVARTMSTVRGDSSGYESLMGRMVPRSQALFEEILAPLHVPRRPVVLAEFGIRAMQSSVALGRKLFQSDEGRALFAGLGAHSMLPLEERFSAASGLVLALAAHTSGWPIAKGGAHSIPKALASYFMSLGGTIARNTRVESFDQLDSAKIILADLTPPQLLRIAGKRLTPKFQRKLEKYRFGPAAYKIDWALSQPIPWRSAECSQAATLHLGGSAEEISASEGQVWNGSVAKKPFVLLSQPSLFDPSRAPGERQTAWAYCHVPNGFELDVTDLIEAQVERFAPGFRDCILGRSVMNPNQLEAHNRNLVGGDIAAGVMDFGQLFFRPTNRFYATSDKRLFLCSASTPPGPGVHGMCGYYAAKAALEAMR